MHSQFRLKVKGFWQKSFKICYTCLCFQRKKKRKNKKQVKTNYNNSYYVYHMNSLKIPKKSIKERHTIQWKKKRNEKTRQKIYFNVTLKHEQYYSHIHKWGCELREFHQIDFLASRKCTCIIKYYNIFNNKCVCPVWLTFS